MFDIVNVLKMRVDVITDKTVTEQVLKLVESKKGSYVCVSNVHMCMETFDSPTFKQVVNGADLIIADGRPIYWAQKLLGAKTASHVRGQDLMERLCELSVSTPLRIGLYGAPSQASLEKTMARLKEKHPGIDVAYAYSPPFRPLTREEDERVISEIHAAKVDVLFVGIGCPKQEQWMADHKDSLNCVMLGVGAAFDFIAGTKKHAPRALQYLGLEWFYRLLSEPRRLAGRYLRTNPRFIYHFSLQWLFGKRY